MLMFDAKHGKLVAQRVYERIIDHNDLRLWYDNYAVVHYDIDECWAHATDTEVGAMELDADDLIGLMAYVLSESTFDIDTDLAWDVFGNGFVYALGQIMRLMHESKED